MNRITGAALLGMVAGVLVASAIGGLSRRRPHTVLGALAGFVLAGAGEALYLIVVTFWPLLVAAGVIVVAALTAAAAQTFSPRRLPPEVPDDYDRASPWDT